MLAPKTNDWKVLGDHEALVGRILAQPRLQVNGRYKRVSWQKVTRLVFLWRGSKGNDGWSTTPPLGTGLRNKGLNKALIIHFFFWKGYIWGGIG